MILSCHLPIGRNPNSWEWLGDWHLLQEVLLDHTGKAPPPTSQPQTLLRTLFLYLPSPLSLLESPLPAGLLPDLGPMLWTQTRKRPGFLALLKCFRSWARVSGVRERSWCIFRAGGCLAAITEGMGWMMAAWQDSVGSGWGLDTDASPLGTAHWLQTGVTALILGPQWETLAGAQEAGNLLSPVYTMGLL